jgi:hypothetical protein
MARTDECLRPLVPARRATWPKLRAGYSTCCHMPGPECAEAVLHDRAVFLPAFSHFLIVNKTSRALSLSRARALALSLSLSVSGKPGTGGVRYPQFFSLGRSPVSHPTCDVPFPPRRTGRYRKGMISARPSYKGVRRSVWDPKTFAQGGRTSHGARRLEPGAK